MSARVTDTDDALPAASAAAAPAAADFTVKLDDQQDRVGDVTEDELKARILGMRVDVFLRIALVLVIAGLFIWLNRQVMQFVRDAFEADLRLMSAKPPLMQPADRLVTANVVMALIGATAVQVGVTIVSIVSYLFPKPH